MTGISKRYICQNGFPILSPSQGEVTVNHCNAPETLNPSLVIQLKPNNKVLLLGFPVGCQVVSL